MKITICIGSSCHIKGSGAVVESMQKMIEENKLEKDIELCGSFCMGRCVQGVCVTIDDDFFSVSPETVGDFFEKEVKARLS
ncbi:MAG: (2Fe-2S) ferredoxin domain-containing protein [Firmicutes bacterium]|nr:(2Fe-2S) ferredoxin domain-containing protein [Bacillota bacterium]